MRYALSVAMNLTVCQRCQRGQAYFHLGVALQEADDDDAPGTLSEVSLQSLYQVARLATCPYNSAVTDRPFSRLVRRRQSSPRNTHWRIPTWARSCTPRTTPMMLWQPSRRPSVLTLPSTPRIIMLGW